MIAQKLLDRKIWARLARILSRRLRDGVSNIHISFCVPRIRNHYSYSVHQGAGLTRLIRATKASGNLPGSPPVGVSLGQQDQDHQEVGVGARPGRRSVVRKRRSGSLRPTRTLTHPDTCTARSECRPRRLRVSPPESGWSGPHRFRVHPAPRRRVLSGAQGPYRPAH
jgi:hypothetical protein